MTSSGFSSGFLATPLPALGDTEGACVPAGLPPVIDAHVHLFPERVFAKIFRWFDQHGWPVRYQLTAPEVIAFLRSRGVHRMVGLCYAHRPGMARGLNEYMAELCRAHPEVIGLGTVLPGEPDALAIVREAFALGLRGIKLHCHVQGVPPDAPELGPIYELCAARGLPVVVHAGREPKSPALLHDPEQICSVDRIARVLADHPKLALCVPHLGCADYRAYASLVERHDHLWIDTAMILADYLPDDGSATAVVRELVAMRPDRVIYGTDFPILPYAWDRELRWITEAKLADDVLAGLLGGNAARLFGIA
jgi:predicted TIM-barrel fold metal-dependent hydrolase